MPIAKLNGIELYYHQYGTGENVVLISGLTNDHNVWMSMLSALKKSYCVTVFDNRGSGRSSQPGAGYTIRQMADDTVALMRYLGIVSAHIVGHSMGGLILQRIAIHYPHFLKSGVIVGSLCQLSAKARLVCETRLQLMQSGADSGDVLQVAFPWLFTESFLQNKKNLQALKAAILHYPREQTLQGYAGQVHAIFNEDTRRDLSAITCPVLVVAGHEDILAPLSQSEELVSLIPHAKLEIIAHCAHMFQSEQPRKLLEAMLKFYQSI